MKYKYKYIGENPVLLIGFHQEVNPKDIIEVDEPIDNVFFVVVEDKKINEQSKEAK